MPIEIRELVIRTKVNEDASEAPLQQTDATSQEDIVAQCVDKVMDLLKQQMER